MNPDPATVSLAERRNHYSSPLFIAVRVLLAVAVCVGLSACNHDAPPERSDPSPPAPTSRRATQAPEAELFAKNVGPDQRIVITRTPFDIKAFKAVAPGIVGQDATMACISVELRGPDNSSALLGSAMQTDYPDFRTGLEVLDVFIANDEVIVVCTVGDVVGLWRLVFDPHRHLPDGWTWIRPGRHADRTPLPRGSVSATMSTLPDRRWTLTLTDNRGSKPEITHLEQVADAWKFKRIADESK